MEQNTKQYIVSAMVRSDFKQTDVRDNTGIYELGLPLTKESESMQEKMVLIANIIRKFKVYSKNEKYRNTGVTLLPADEWKYVKRMNFIKSKSNKCKISIQQSRNEQNFIRIKE